MSNIRRAKFTNGVFMNEGSISLVWICGLSLMIKDFVLFFI